MLIPYNSGEFLALVKGHVVGVSDLQIARALAKGANFLFRFVNVLRLSHDEDSPGMGIWTIPKAQPAAVEVVRALKVSFPDGAPDILPSYIRASNLGAPDPLISRTDTTTIIEWDIARRQDAGENTPPAVLDYTVAPIVPTLAQLRGETDDDGNIVHFFGLDSELIARFERALRAAAIVEGGLESFVSPNAASARAAVGASSWRGELAGEQWRLDQEFGIDDGGKGYRYPPAFGPEDGGAAIFYGRGLFNSGRNRYIPQQQPTFVFDESLGRTVIAPQS